MKLDPNKTWIPLGVAGAVIAAIAISTWRVSGAFQELRADIRAVATDRWAASDMQDWTYQFASQNKGLNIPNPREVRAARMASEAAK